MRAVLTAATSRASKARRCFGLGVAAGAGAACTGVGSQPSALAPSEGAGGGDRAGVGGRGDRVGGGCRGGERPGAAPLLRFGVIADVQYCDQDDVPNRSRTASRSYRGALVCLRNAVKNWNELGDIAFVANLGDIVDQQNEKLGESHSALPAVLTEFGKAQTTLKLPADWVKTTPALTHRPFVVHLIGNHELYNFSRQELRENLGTNPPPGLTSWYSFSPHPTLRCVVLDPYDLNTIDSKEKTEAHNEGFKFLEQQNKTDLRGRGEVNWLEGLQGKQKRFIPFNGGLRGAQVEWLEQTLQQADDAGERVVVMSHVPMCPRGAKDVCLLWNYEKVLELMRGHPCVAACFAGHDHDGG